MTTDRALVLQALKAFRRIALGFKYGGLHAKVKLSQAALDAFERIQSVKSVSV